MISTTLTGSLQGTSSELAALAATATDSAIVMARATYQHDVSGHLTGSGGTFAIEGAGPANGALILLSDGSFTYLPAADFEGTDGFSFSVTDNLGGVAVAHVTIRVAPNGPATVEGTTGDDILFGGTDENTILGGDGADALIAGAGTVLIHGGQGNDRISGSEFRVPEIHGDEGDDLLYAGRAGDAVLFGGGWQ